MGGSEQEDETIAAPFEQLAGASADLAGLEELMHIFDEVAEEATTWGITPEELRAAEHWYCWRAWRGSSRELVDRRR